MYLNQRRPISDSNWGKKPPFMPKVHFFQSRTRGTYRCLMQSLELQKSLDLILGTRVTEL